VRLKDEGGMERVAAIELDVEVEGEFDKESAELRTNYTSTPYLARFRSHNCSINGRLV